MCMRKRLRQPSASRWAILWLSIHCGSRGLATRSARSFSGRWCWPPRPWPATARPQLACAPINSQLGQDYLGAMRAGINCALANRQILTHLTRQVFAKILPKAYLPLLYDVSHNTCKVEKHRVDGQLKKLHVHRKGATRAFGPATSTCPRIARGRPAGADRRQHGHASYILGGTEAGMQLAFGSACHGAGRAMSRHQALKNWSGSKVINDLFGHAS